MSAENDGSLTMDDALAKIETDYEFAKQVAAGKIVFQEDVETPPPADAPVPEPPALVAPTPAKVEITVPEDKTFQVRQSQLGKYRNPNELLKSHGEQAKFINRQKQTIDELSKQIESLKVQKKDAPDVELAPTDPYDPDTITRTNEEVKILREKVLRFETLEQKLNRLEADREQEKLLLAKQQEISSTYQTLKTIQKEAGIHTEREIDQIDNEWATFIRKLGEISGTDGTRESNLAAYELYTDGVGDDAEELRGLAKAHSLELPKELDKYSSIQKVYRELARYKELNPKITIKQVINILKESGEIEGVDIQESVPQNAPTGRRYDPEKVARALQEKIDAAANIPADFAGEETIAGMSHEEKMKWINTPDTVLSKDPNKLKIVNKIFESLGMPPLKFRK